MAFIKLERVPSLPPVEVRAVACDGELSAMLDAQVERLFALRDEALAGHGILPGTFAAPAPGSRPVWDDEAARTEALLAIMAFQDEQGGFPFIELRYEEPDEEEEAAKRAALEELLQKECFTMEEFCGLAPGETWPVEVDEHEVSYDPRTVEGMRNLKQHEDSERYIYEPSYACCQMLMRAVVDGVAPAGAEAVLARALDFCRGACSFECPPTFDMGLGHWIATMGAFARAGAPDLFARFPDMCADFCACLFETMSTECSTSLLLGETVDDGGASRTFELMEVMEAYGYRPRIGLFCYGTLLSGMPDAGLVADCTYQGKALTEELRLHVANGRPVAVRAPGFDVRGNYAEGERRGPAGPVNQVMGELRLCSLKEVRALMEAPGIGGSLSLDPVAVTLADPSAYTASPLFHPEEPSLGHSVRHAYAFVSREVPTGEAGAEVPAVPLYLQPYNRLAALQKTHVWLVCYGCELEYQSFMPYISGGRDARNGRLYAGCDDPTPPLAECAWEIPYEPYFGGIDPAWGEAIAFLNLEKPGTAHGRAYLISRAQYAQVRAALGEGPRRFDCEVALGERFGIPAVALTNSGGAEWNSPRGGYLNAMRAGLDEAYSLLGDEVEKYLSRMQDW